MLPPTAVAFDLDGTLIDSRGDIVAAMNYALARTGHQPQPAAQIIRFVGDGARTLCARAAHVREGAEEVDALLKLFVDYYVQHPIDFTRWAKGAREALDAFAEEMPEVALGLCTNKARSVTDAVLAALGIRTRFAPLSLAATGLSKSLHPARCFIWPGLCKSSPATS